MKLVCCQENWLHCLAFNLICLCELTKTLPINLRAKSTCEFWAVHTVICGVILSLGKVFTVGNIWGEGKCEISVKSHRRTKQKDVNGLSQIFMETITVFCFWARSVKPPPKQHLKPLAQFRLKRYHIFRREFQTSICSTLNYQYQLTI